MADWNNPFEGFFNQYQPPIFAQQPDTTPSPLYYGPYQDKPEPGPAQPLSNPPMPRPDPRGNNWIARTIPLIPNEMYGPFYRNEIPPQMLMERSNIKQNPDRLSIHPNDVMNQYFLRSMMQQAI